MGSIKLKGRKITLLPEWGSHLIQRPKPGLCKVPAYPASGHVGGHLVKALFGLGENACREISVARMRVSHWDAWEPKILEIDGWERV